MQVTFLSHNLAYKTRVVVFWARNSVVECTPDKRKADRSNRFGTKVPFRLTARTLSFHGKDTGSTPVWDSNLNIPRKLKKAMVSFTRVNIPRSTYHSQFI